MVLFANSFTKRTTSTNGNGNGDGWGTGFLLVLFPEEDESNSNSRHSSKKTTTTTFLPLCSPTTPGTRRRLIHKTQSTLSICGLLVFTTFLLFTLSTFEPATAIRSRSSSPLPRRFLSSPSSSAPLTTKLSNYLFPRHNPQPHSAPAALQGMGTLHRRGTRAMSDLLVAHVSHEMDDHQLRSFLRILHNTGVLSRSDLVFLFPSLSLTSRFSDIIADENDSFFQLLSAANISTNNGTTAPPDIPYGLTRYFPLSKTTGPGEEKKKKSKEAKEPIWGKKRGNRSSGDSISTTSSYQQVAGPSYGSVVSFEASELDPENTLSGFMDRLPIGLRRWACYPMLLGRVRRKYKHMALTDVNDVLILNDPFTKIRNLPPESVMLWTQHTPPETGKHAGSKKGSHHSHGHNNHPPHHDESTTITPGIVVGGNRGVRKLSEAVLTEIVRTAITASSTTKRGKSPLVTESGIVNQLVRGGRVLKNVDLVIHDGEPIAEAGEIVVGLRTGQTGWGGNVVTRWGSGPSGNGNSLPSGGNSFRSVIDREVCCLSELQRVVYRDCLATSDQ